ncbi:MAG TPA: Na(+)/H(+) antiporter subunit B [Verrucomicrobia bacterium]|nr:MAG: Na(+)/H(+) antiporter subunit B [Lentisphaerae bacterium GWF2_57_35]HBA84438.1 Na(+)/H(+) antiporter subunit B [Verrucomicrobiota bacterium]
MNSLILQIAARYLHPLLLLYSWFLLLSGHNDPGGGFTGGLVAAASFALYMIAYGVEQTRRALRVDPLQLAGAGLLIAVLSGLLGMFRPAAFLTGVWIAAPFPVWGVLDAGTPMLFDLGVYLVVMGVSIKLVFTFAED